MAGKGAVEKGDAYRPGHPLRRRSDFNRDNKTDSADVLIAARRNGGKGVGDMAGTGRSITRSPHPGRQWARKRYS